MIKKLYTIVLTIIFSTSLVYSSPATHAYLSVPRMKKRVEKSWAPECKKYKTLIDQALEQELAYEKTHHVFYHAQKCDFRIVQDFLNQLYSFLYPNTVIKDFYFLRPWYEYAYTIDANSFIDTYEMGTPCDWNDNHSHLSRAMLSVNFSLFGNTKNYGNFGECTFKYFFNNKSIKAPATQSLFNEIFGIFAFDKSYIASLLELGETMRTDEGSLFQIFVPINVVDEIAFAAQRLGTPYRNGLLIPSLFNHTKQRYTQLTPILDVYQNNPQQFGSTLDRLQGRLLFCRSVLLNPESGVKMFRYTTVDPEKLKTYQQKLTKLTNQLFASWSKKLSKKQKKALYYSDIHIKAI